MTPRLGKTRRRAETRTSARTMRRHRSWKKPPANGGPLTCSGRRQQCTVRARPSDIRARPKNEGDLIIEGQRRATHPPSRRHESRGGTRVIEAPDPVKGTQQRFERETPESLHKIDHVPFRKRFTPLEKRVILTAQSIPGG
ncbi:hypothetical protein NDU88_000695 [Pleurodeles waltl]|uniref:Uncharacterized protein n=1 Tax=Pleurodeles waltl TaxID=8319 RepID=A0AAV7VYX9_PLEWA|nr:hypothetical protein NDU88_000695 [Pleurodeles waltl]